MMSFSRDRLLAHFVVIAAMLAAGCVGVDDTLGQEFIPDDQRMSTRIVTLGEAGDPVYLTTRLVQKDSVSTSRTGAMLIGSMYDPVLGYTSSGTVIQPVPYTSPKSADTDTTYFGDGAVADSMMLNLAQNTYSGKTLDDQSFTIYELITPISPAEIIDPDDPEEPRTLYYADFDAESFCDMARPLFRFTLSGTGDLNVRLTDAGFGQQYMDRLVELDWDFEDRSKFISNGFYGLYIVPDNPSADAAIYNFTLSSSYSYFKLYTHNEHDQNRSMEYVFDDYIDSYYGYSPSISINCIDHDYSAGSAGEANINFNPEPNSLAATPEVPTAYVQGLDGVYTQLTFTEALGERLAELSEGMNMAIQNATVYLELDGQQPSDIAAFTRLGMYDGWIRLKNIPDYQPEQESYSGAELPYGGYLTRDPGYYSMNITALVQKLAKGADGFALPYTVSVTPDLYENLSMSRVALKGSAAEGGDYRIKLKLTYTLIP